MAFSYKIDEVNGIKVILMNGYVDYQAGLTIRKIVEEDIRAGFKKIVFDFTLAPIVNSMGLAEILELVSMSIKETDLRFIFCGLSGPSMNCFQVAGIFLFAILCKTREEALKHE